MHKYASLLAVFVIITQYLLMLQHWWWRRVTTDASECVTVHKHSDLTLTLQAQCIVLCCPTSWHLFYCAASKEVMEEKCYHVYDKVIRQVRKKIFESSSSKLSSKNRVEYNKTIEQYCHCDALQNSEIKMYPVQRAIKQSKHQNSDQWHIINS